MTNGETLGRIRESVESTKQTVVEIKETVGKIQDTQIEQGKEIVQIQTTLKINKTFSRNKQNLLWKISTFVISIMLIVVAILSIWGHNVN